MRIRLPRSWGATREIDEIIDWLAARIEEDVAAAGEQPDPTRAMNAVAAKRRNLYHARPPSTSTWTGVGSGRTQTSLACK